MICFGKQYKVVDEEHIRESKSLPCCLHWSLAPGFTFFFDKLPKIIHTKDEEIGRQGVPLSNSFGWVEIVEASPIKENRSDDCGHTTHDNLNQSFRKTSSCKHVPDEAPFQLVIGFLKINFNCHVANLSFLPTDSIN